MSCYVNCISEEIVLSAKERDYILTDLGFTRKEVVSRHIFIRMGKRCITGRRKWKEKLKEE